MKIAVASQNFRTVTPHAGKTRRWLVFEMEKGADPVETGRLDLPREMALHDYGGTAPHPVFDMDAILVGSCGAGFPARMARHGVRVAATEETDPLLAVKAFIEAGGMEKPLATGPENGVHAHEHGHGGCSCHGHE